MDDYLTPSQVARRLHVDVTTVQRWIRVGAIDAKAIKYGTRTRYFIQVSTIEAIEQRENHRALV
jgi:excisionase family DNA binding protein